MTGFQAGAEISGGLAEKDSMCFTASFPPREGTLSGGKRSFGSGEPPHDRRVLGAVKSESENVFARTCMRV